MPFYEYRCEDCKKTFDLFVRSLSSKYQVECPECGGKNCRKSISLFGTASAGRSATTSAASCAPSG